jgi:hypothetical protein
LDLTGYAEMGHFSSPAMSDNALYVVEAAPGFSFFDGSLSLEGVATGLSGNALVNGVSNAYSATLLGMKMVLIPRRWRWFGVGLSYYPSANMTAQGTSTADAHSGTAYAVDAGFYIKLGSRVDLSLRFNYYSMSYKTITTNNVSTAEDYSLGLLVPTAGLRFGF